MSEAPKPRRRWLRFSLRTMFAMITVFAMWLGWNVQQVRSRAEMAREIELRGGSVLPSVPHFEAHGHLPYSWWFLGVRPVGFVTLGESHPRQDWDRIEQLFPEATLMPYVADLGPVISLPDADDWARMTKRHRAGTANGQLKD